MTIKDERREHWGCIHCRRAIPGTTAEAHAAGWLHWTCPECQAKLEANPPPRFFTVTKLDYCRQLQDKLVAACLAAGMSDDDPVADDLPRELTVGLLREHLFPLFEGSMYGLLKHDNRGCSLSQLRKPPKRGCKALPLFAIDPDPSPS